MHTMKGPARILFVSAAAAIFLEGCRTGPGPVWTDVPVVQCGQESEAGVPGRVEGAAFVMDHEGRRIRAWRKDVNLDPETEESVLWFSRAVCPEEDREAFVSVSSTMMDRRLRVKTADDGTFAFESVPPGRYFVTARVTWYVPSPPFRLAWDLDFMEIGATAYARVEVHGGGQPCQILVTRPGETFEPSYASTIRSSP
jgi:hypothetical protein